MSKCGIPYVINDDGSAGQALHAARGCKEKSRGCGDATGGGCYAARLAATRLKNMPQYRTLPASDGSTQPLARMTDAGPRWTGEVRLFLGELDKPPRRRNPTTWFVADMGDIGHEKVPDGFLLHLFEMMANAQSQRFLLLTKRPERLADWLAKWADAITGEPLEPQLVEGPEATREAHPSPRGQMFAEYLELMGDPPAGCAYPTFDWLEGMRRWPPYWFLPNVWLGVTAEGRKEFLERVPQLLRLDADRAAPGGIRCAGFWVSVEPQVGDVGDVMEYLAPAVDSEYFAGPCEHGSGLWTRCGEGCDHRRPGLSWVVQGCESGPGARPFEPAWAVSLHEQCQLADQKPGNRVTYFYKQADGGRDKMPELYGRTWRDVPWSSKKH